MVNKLGLNTPGKAKRSLGAPSPKYDSSKKNVVDKSLLVQSTTGQSGIVMNHEQFKHTAIKQNELN